MRPFRFILRLAPAFLIHSAAIAQTPPVLPDVPVAPQSNSAIVAPPADTAGNPQRPSREFKILVPDGFGGLKEAPGITESAPDQTGSTSPLTEPNGDH